MFTSHKKMNISFVVKEDKRFYHYEPIPKVSRDDFFRERWGNKEFLENLIRFLVNKFRDDLNINKYSNSYITSNNVVIENLISPDLGGLSDFVVSKSIKPYPRMDDVVILENTSYSNNPSKLFMILTPLSKTDYYKKERTIEELQSLVFMLSMDDTGKYCGDILVDLFPQELLKENRVHFWEQIRNKEDLNSWFSEEDAVKRQKISS